MRHRPEPILDGCQHLDQLYKSSTAEQQRIQLRTQTQSITEQICLCDAELLHKFNRILLPVSKMQRNVLLYTGPQYNIV